MKLLPLLIAGAALLMSCENKKVAIADTQTTTAATADTLTPNNSELTAQVANSEVSAPVAATTSGTKPALNPAHGEPFHRCDIQVGAPIDSAPQAAPAQAMPQAGATPNSFNTNPISPSAAPTANVQATGPKPALNPAHGEPHHRCDLQVGQPLT